LVTEFTPNLLDDLYLFAYIFNKYGIPTRFFDSLNIDTRQTSTSSCQLKDFVAYSAAFAAF